MDLDAPNHVPLVSLPAAQSDVPHHLPEEGGACNKCCFKHAPNLDCPTSRPRPKVSSELPDALVEATPFVPMTTSSVIPPSSSSSQSAVERSDQESWTVVSSKDARPVRVFFSGRRKEQQQPANPQPCLGECGYAASDVAWPVSGGVEQELKKRNLSIRQFCCGSCVMQTTGCVGHNGEHNEQPHGPRCPMLILINQASSSASPLADENLLMNNSDAVVQAASLGARLAVTIHQRALGEAPKSDVVDGLAAEAVAQTGTAGFGARAAVGFFVLTASADKHLGF